MLVQGHRKIFNLITDAMQGMIENPEMDQGIA